MEPGDTSISYEVTPRRCPRVCVMAAVQEFMAMFGTNAPGVFTFFGRGKVGTARR